MADEQRALALGMQSVMFRVLGSIPGPIIFGAIFDSACVYWQYECGKRGNCWVYDNDNLSLRAFAMGFTGLGLNVVLSFTAWAFYPSSGLSHDDASTNDSGALGPEPDQSPDEMSLLPPEDLKDAEREGSVGDNEQDETTTL